MKNTTVVLFGATGDLAKRKIIPALYRFVEKNKLERFTVIGVAFNEVTSQQMIDAARPFVKHSEEKYWDILYKHSFYKKINFTEADDYNDLSRFIQECENLFGVVQGNRLFYLATAAQFFCPITHNLARSRAMQKKLEGDSFWHRIVYEKPFGYDLACAHEINACINAALDESQVYRIDHYLTKEVVSNIAMIRFTNVIFEPLWSNRYIDQVQIVLSESLGMEGRGRYYDLFGAVRDVVQNHILELLALTCMEAPEKLTGDFIRQERAKILEKVRFDDGIFGQCESYHDEPGVVPSSHTETYASLKFFVDNVRWTGVPFYVKTGKYLDKKETAIHIKFKSPDCLLMKGCPLDSNWLTIKIAPDAVFLLTLNAKRPGSMDQVIPVGMEFCHSCIFGLQTPEAYEVLLKEVMRGEQSVAVRFDEIEYTWKITDTILAKNLPLYVYKKGSVGPQEAEEFAQKHGMRWRS